MVITDPRTAVGTNRGRAGSVHDIRESGAEFRIVRVWRNVMTACLANSCLPRYFTPVGLENVTWRTCMLIRHLLRIDIHCFFLFLEMGISPWRKCSSRLLEDNSPGSIKYIGTPA
ncbi:hypothetical protein GGR58DRAFT_277660 [Xylaria digitata]|nr:hypothetical protein GGR58DRAFT_277660 [Xylaria digitata]